MRDQQAINAKIAAALAGRQSPKKGRVVGPWTDEMKATRRANTESRWRDGPWESVPRTRWYDRIMLEQSNGCAICKNPPSWMGKPLKFQLDHTSGDKTDERRGNLRLLCPNCHFQTPTWGARNASVTGKEKIREALASGRKNRTMARSTGSSKVPSLDD
jgi:hypothetical protein